MGNESIQAPQEEKTSPRVRKKSQRTRNRASRAASVSNQVMGNEAHQAQQKDNHEPATAEIGSSAAHAKTPSPTPSRYPRGLSIVGAAGSPDDIPLTRNNFRYLQRTIGNRAVVHLLHVSSFAVEADADAAPEAIVGGARPKGTARTRLPELWLRGLECRAFIQGVEVNLSDSYDPKQHPAGGYKWL